MGSSHDAPSTKINAGKSMSKIICISKYPPLEGGIAAKTYWLTKALAERGHTIHVVTDWIGVDETHTIEDIVPESLLPNIVVHRAISEQPWILPSDQHRALALWDKALEVAQTYPVDVIDSTYLVPYGLVGHFVSQSTGLPHIIRHGGSDVQKFIMKGIWPNLWPKVLSEARVVITDHDNRSSVEPLASRTRIMAPHVPDPHVFTTVGRKTRERPVLALIGKANYYWQHKGWRRIIDIWSRLDDSFEFMIISQGNGLNDFKRFVLDRLGDRVTWRKFVAPWQMPKLLRSIDGLFHFQTDLPFPTFSNIALEALYCGSSLIVDRPDVQEQYLAHNISLNPDKHFVLPVSHTNLSIAAQKIKGHMNQFRKLSEPVESTDHSFFVKSNEEIIRLYQSFPKAQAL